ncbi:transposase [Comamonas flocculans]|uniref:Transposase n=1 Tax=Comamonas flocculans TaxID=2597701 RepID=A0A5B8RRZ5_9BURK|nr:transposase [Comamonas flocculans]
MLPKRSAYSAQFKLQVLAHQDREQLSSRQVAALYDIRNSNQVVVWRRSLDQGRLQTLEIQKEERPKMEPERSREVPPNMVAPDAARTLREENERLRAEVAYLKKLQALIRSKRSAAPTTACAMACGPRVLTQASSM